jgi:hypothetical protein
MEFFIKDLSDRGFTTTIYGEQNLVEFMLFNEEEFLELLSGDIECLIADGHAKGKAFLLAAKGAADMWVGDTLRTNSIEVIRIV